MLRVRDAVKFGASRVCPMCNSGCWSNLAVPESAVELMVGDSDRRTRGKQKMSAFEEHKEELEKFEQLFGRERGRLAVSLDRLTNALVLVGQHGVYCTSQRNPAVPAMDLRTINQELVHAKELVQSVMEELRRAKEPKENRKLEK
jgi:hypothetical protein